MKLRWLRTFSRNIQTDSKFCVSEEVREALHTNRGVVALESTLITHGLPVPENLRIARRLEQIVRENKCIPATIAVMDNVVHVGLNQKQLEYLSLYGNPSKVSIRDLAIIASKNFVGGTTVSATMYAAHRAGITVFATGGLGGVHRDFIESMDVSNDLTELGRIPIAVVSAGIKSILDIPRSLEYLETQGVPVITFGSSNDFPGFYKSKSGHKSPYFSSCAEEIAKIIDTGSELGLKQGFLIAVPIPEGSEKYGDAIEEAIKLALFEARNNGISGKDITPYVLKFVCDLTGGKSLLLNVKLLENNALKASQIANALSKLKSEKVQSVSETNRQHLCSTADDKVDVMAFGGIVLDCYAHVSNEAFSVNVGQCLQGDVHIHPGGVARNHADALTKLGVKSGLLSVVGDDNNGLLTRDLCMHMNFRHVRTIPGERTASYIGVTAGGSLKIGVLSTDVFRHISPDMIGTVEHLLKSAKFCIVDANLPVETISTICCICDSNDIPVWYDPSDYHVAEKIITAKCWDKITYFSPNLMEFEKIMSALGKKNFDNLQEWKQADLYDLIVERSSWLMTKMLRTVILTMDSRGIIVINKNEDHDYCLTHYSSPIVSENPINVSGAGDCLNSGIIYGILNNWTIDKCVDFGLKLAAMSLRSIEPIPSFTDVIGKKSMDNYEHKIIFSKKFPIHAG